MNRPQFTLIHQDKEWQAFIAERELKQRVKEQEEKARRDADERLISELRSKGFKLYTCFRIPEFFSACFPGETKRSHTKRMVFAKKNRQLEGLYFKRCDMGFYPHAEWYELKRDAIPEKYWIDVGGIRLLHEKFMTYMVAPTVEYRK